MNRQLRSILEETEGGRRYLAQLDGEKRARARRVAAKPAVRGRKARAKDRRRSAVEARRSTRAECEERAGGRCEVGALGGCRGALEHDHFWGRSKVAPDMRAEWMLCTEHHRQKTENRPSRAWWIGVFRLHAGLRGYGEQVAKCDTALALEEAQHPTRGASRALEGRR